MRSKAAKVDRSEVLKKILTDEAYNRLRITKISSPVIASQLESYLIDVYQAGQLKGKVNDAKLKQVLGVLMIKRKKRK